MMASVRYKQRHSHRKKPNIKRWGSNRIICSFRNVTCETLSAGCLRPGSVTMDQGSSGLWPKEDP